MSTANGKINSNNASKWYVFDAEGVVLGRLSTRIATMLMGKNKPCYTSNQLTGDHIVVVNAEKIRVTGNKKELKLYKNFSGYPGGLKEAPFKDVIVKKPVKPLEHAVKGMLPKSGLGNSMFKRLHVYAGPQHPHEAQKCEKIELK